MSSTQSADKRCCCHSGCEPQEGAHCQNAWRTHADETSRLAEVKLWLCPLFVVMVAVVIFVVVVTGAWVLMGLVTVVLVLDTGLTALEVVLVIVDVILRPGCSSDPWRRRRRRRRTEILHESNFQSWHWFKLHSCSIFYILDRVFKSHRSGSTVVKVSESHTWIKQCNVSICTVLRYGTSI